MPESTAKPVLLHVCTRDTIRPLRDHVLRLKGIDVDSTLTHEEVLSRFVQKNYDLVLIDVEGDGGVHGAERLCSEIKSVRPTQRVAFVCNWRVANLTDCPDDVVRTEFDPEAFAEGVTSILPQSPN